MSLLEEQMSCLNRKSCVWYLLLVWTQSKEFWRFQFRQHIKCEWDDNIQLGNLAQIRVGFAIWFIWAAPNNYFLALRNYYLKKINSVVNKDLNVK